MPFANSSYSDILTTTIENRSRELADNWTNNNALIRRLKAKGNVKPFSGGWQIMQEIGYTDPTTINVNSYSGYEVININPNSPISSAAFAIKQSKNITGLAAAVPDDPTTGTYGGIPRTNTFWRSQFFRGVTDGGAAVSAANIQSYMTTLALRCVRGNNKPDLWIGDATYFAFYVNSLQSIQRIQSENGDGKAGGGFGPELAFYGGGMAATVVMGGGISGAVTPTQLTSGATSAHMWGLNTDYIFWRPHRDRNFVPIGGERQSVNQDAVVKLFGVAGNITSSGPQFSGVLIA